MPSAYWKLSVPCPTPHGSHWQPAKYPDEGSGRCQRASLFWVLRCVCTGSLEESSSPKACLWGGFRNSDDMGVRRLPPNPQQIIRQTALPGTPPPPWPLASGLQEPPETPHPRGAACPPPTRTGRGCPTYSLCWALRASPTPFLSLKAIRSDFLVTDAVRFPGPGESDNGGLPSPARLAAFLRLPTSKRW